MLPEWGGRYVKGLLDLEGLRVLREGLLEVAGLQTQEGLLEFEGLLAEDDADIAAVVFGEERLQLLARVGQLDPNLVLAHPGTNLKL